MKNKLPDGEYIIKLDVTLTGEIVVKAKTQQEAAKKVEKQLFSSNELYSFHQIDSLVREVRCIS